MTGHIRKACVIGWPIAHSRSPMIHGYWLKRHNIAGTYSKIAVPTDEVDAFLANLEQRGLVGCNVTVPHKERAFQLATHRDASATAVGAANTLWIENQTLCCMNTDSYGFMTNLEASAPEWRHGSDRAVVLGAGGSARAVIYGLLDAGVADVCVVNRSLARAQELAARFGAKVTAHAWSDRKAVAANACVIINTTTLGMNGDGDPDIDFTAVPEQCVAADLVYVPKTTGFLAAAERAHRTTVGGLGMLLHQAVPGFEKWFGVRPEVTPELVAAVECDIASGDKNATKPEMR